MKTLLLKSNHGNHSGFNRTWEILEEFENEDLAKSVCARMHNEIKDLEESDPDFEDEHEGINGFENDLYYYTTITQEDYNKGIFNGGYYGYASDSIKKYFEEEE